MCFEKMLWEVGRKSEFIAWTGWALFQYLEELVKNRTGRLGQSEGKEKEVLAAVQRSLSDETAESFIWQILARQEACSVVGIG